MLFKKVPLKIIKGASKGDATAIAALTFEEVDDINEANEVEALATKITVPQAIKNVTASLFKLLIQ